MSTFFIPEVVEINDVKIPSTPFKASNGKAIFLGDVFEVSFSEDDETTKEVYSAQLIQGSYMGTCKNPTKDTEMWMHEAESIRILGSSITHPSLLDLLSE